jgi:hypothetical protein
MGVVPLCGTEIAVGSVGTRGTMDVFTGTIGSSRRHD